MLCACRVALDVFAQRRGVCTGKLTVGGDIEAKMIEAEGKIVCNTLKCENIKGDVTVNNEN